MRVIVRSTQFAKEHKAEIEKTADLVISIRNPGESVLFTPSNKVLTLWFDDCNPLGAFEYSLTAMSRAQAEEIVEKVNALSEDSLVFIHCSAGVCRSGGVGEFIHITRNVKNFYEDNPSILPNEWVKELLLSVFLESK